MALAVSTAVASAQIGVFDNHMDIDGGRLGAAGSATYGAATNTYTVTGSGHDIWDDADNFHFVYKQLSGDFILTGLVGIEGGLATQDWIKSMFMARQSLDPSSINIGNRIRRDGQYSMQWRSTPTTWSSTAAADRVVIPNPSMLRFERQGDTFITSYQAADGSWVEVDREDLVMEDPILVGLAVTAHDVGELATGTFQNVELVQPTQTSSAKNWNLYE